MAGTDAEHGPGEVRTDAAGTITAPHVDALDRVRSVAHRLRAVAVRSEGVADAAAPPPTARTTR